MSEGSCFVLLCSRCEMHTCNMTTTADYKVNADYRTFCGNNKLTRAVASISMNILNNNGRLFFFLFSRWGRAQHRGALSRYQFGQTRNQKRQIRKNKCTSEWKRKVLQSIINKTIMPRQTHQVQMYNIVPAQCDSVADSSSAFVFADKGSNLKTIFFLIPAMVALLSFQFSLHYHLDKTREDKTQGK